MVIWVSGQTIDPKNISQTLLTIGFLEQNAKKFLKRDKIIFTKQTPTIHVFQKEFICVDLSNTKKIKYIGSSEATTCSILCLFSKKSGRSFCVHLDGQSDSQLSKNGELDNLIEKYFGDDDSSIIMHLVGSYCDEKNTSSENVQGILLLLSSKQQNFNLHTFCVDKFNTIKKGDYNVPLCTNLCISIESGEAFPSEYVNPTAQLCDNEIIPFGLPRQVKVSHGNGMLFPISYKKEELIIEKFDWTSMSVKNCQILCILDNETILKYCSTSPFAESDSFVPILKKGCEFQLKYRCGDDFFKELILKNKSCTTFKFVLNQENIWKKVV